jgi:hypothetical protein
MSKRKSRSAEFIGKFRNRLKHVPDAKPKPRDAQWAHRAISFSRFALRESIQREQEAAEIQVPSREAPASLLEDSRPGARRRAFRHASKKREAALRQKLKLLGLATGKCHDGQSALTSVDEAGFDVPVALVRDLAETSRRLGAASVDVQTQLFGRPIAEEVGKGGEVTSRVPRPIVRRHRSRHRP